MALFPATSGPRTGSRLPCTHGCRSCQWTVNYSLLLTSTLKVFSRLKILNLVVMWSVSVFNPGQAISVTCQPLFITPASGQKNKPPLLNFVRVRNAPTSISVRQSRMFLSLWDTLHRIIDVRRLHSLRIGRAGINECNCDFSPLDHDCLAGVGFNNFRLADNSAVIGKH
jgi:hypothetical protein